MHEMTELLGATPLDPTRVSQIFQDRIGLPSCNTCFGVIKFRFKILGNYFQKLIPTLPNIDTHTYTPIDIDLDIYKHTNTPIPKDHSI